MTTCSFEFTVILGNNEKELTLKDCTDIFSENRHEIFKWISEVGGTIVNSNTVKVFSNEAFTELLIKLSSLTAPRKLSKKR
ncbi:MAG: hypothetical protein IJE05_05715 [Clostridia bacterium]|nr:hypothetical protein [Clostridia bacterium]